MEKPDIKIDGSIAFDRDVRIFGSIFGSVTVPTGRSFDLHGIVDHDLIVESGAVAIVRGIVRGTLINKGGDVSVTGVVGAVNDWDELRPTQLLPDGTLKVS